MGRASRWLGYLGLAARRAFTMAVRTERGRTGLSVLGVGLAVALMLIVTSVGLGLVGQNVVGGGTTDYAIVPASSASSTVVDVGGARLGRVHPVSDRLNARDDVAFATPVLTQLVQVRGPDGTTERVLAVGVIPRATRDAVVGVRTASLTPGDPYYANGSYDGSWTGEAVVSRAAAEALNLSTGDRVRIPGRRAADRGFVVADVSPAQRAGIAQFPVMVVHLGELQAIVGATRGDAADQILVDARGQGVEPALERIYPDSRVTRRGDLIGQATQDPSQLPLAMTVGALIVAIAVGTLFLMTTMGFEVTATRHERAVLAAMGVARGSRALLLAGQTVGTAVLGGIVGAALWLLGVILINEVLTAFATTVPIAVVRPVMVAYGLGVAAVMGLLTLPYLLVISRRGFDISVLQN